MNNLKVKDNVKLIELGENHKFLGGFEIGLTGKIIDFINPEYPVIQWDSPIQCKNDLITKSDVHFSKLEVLL